MDQNKMIEEEVEFQRKSHAIVNKLINNNFSKRDVIEAAKFFDVVEELGDDSFALTIFCCSKDYSPVEEEQILPSSIYEPKDATRFMFDGMNIKEDEYVEAYLFEGEDIGNIVLTAITNKNEELNREFEFFDFQSDNIELATPTFIRQVSGICLERGASLSVAVVLSYEGLKEHVMKIVDEAVPHDE